MSGLLDRLRRALGSRYTVEAEVARGGMAAVFRARDPALERTVAIKVLLPRLATARGAKRFLREARTIARLTHPHVIAIHEVGEADGLFYYVMDFVAGETLRERLSRGPLAPERAIRVGLDVLAALGAAHAQGIVHRDVKPGNVFLSGGRAVVADFGIARAVAEETGEDLTVPGERVGTPGYMAPEQAEGEKATPRSDLYAAGMLVYEALTGRKWSLGDEPEQGDWSGVPPRLARPLRRALARPPEDRWPDAASFREALRRVRQPVRVHLRPLATAGIAALLALGALWALVVAGRRGPGGGGATTDVGGPLSDLAVLPCRAFPETDATLGAELANIAGIGLEGVPDLRLANIGTSFRWWAASGGDPTGSHEALRAKSVLACQLIRTPGTDSLEVRVQLLERTGRPVHTAELYGTAEGRGFIELGDRMALSVFRYFRPREDRGYGFLQGHPAEAVKAFLQGEAAFRRDARMFAERRYENAVALDSTFTLARWRLADTRRWIPKQTGTDLVRLYRQHADELPPLDRLLLAARIAPHDPEQLARYEETLRRYPDDAYATLLYGDELFHRGPLWGIPPDSAVRVLEMAARKDPLLAPAYDHLAQAHIRAGRRAEARRALDRLRAVAAPDSEVYIHYPEFWEQAFRARFDPERAAPTLEALLPGSRDDASLASAAARYALSLGLPGTQIQLARQLAERSPPRTPEEKAGLLALGLALFAAGRPAEALVSFDAAARYGEAAGRLLAAQWRTIPGAVGHPGVPEMERRRGQTELRRLAGDEELPAGIRMRALWTLALAEGAEGEQWMERLRALATSGGRPGDSGDRAASAGARPGAAAPERGDGWGRLVTLLEAVGEARKGRYREALRVSQPLLAYDSAGNLTRPFARAVLYLQRGEWLEASGDGEGAEAAWRWHEHADAAGVTVPGLRAGEVDWAFGSWARLRRARLAARAGRGAEACALAREVLRLWRDPEPALRGPREEARSLGESTCSR